MELVASLKAAIAATAEADILLSKSTKFFGCDSGKLFLSVSAAGLSISASLKCTAYYISIYIYIDIYL